MTDTIRYYTPPQLATRLVVKVQRVHGWLRKGELVGVNVGDRSRPRWRIAPDALAAFEAARSSRPPAPKPKPRGRQLAAATTEYF